jgi:hypothetical protein
LRLGARRWGGDGIAARFSGRILSQRRLALDRPQPPEVRLPGRAPIELTVVFPSDRNSGQDPLVATGVGPDADLLYCIYDGPGHVQFALDHRDSGGPQGASVAYDPTRASVLEIWMGSLAEPGAKAPGQALVPPERRVLVWLDGAVALNEIASFSPAAPETIALGRNPFGSTQIAPRFAGRIVSAGQPANAAPLPPMRAAGQYGSVDLRLQFPRDALGATEPLVVTGATGAGDLLYVHYEDASHLRFGLDHWGAAGLDGRVVETDLGAPHHLEITMGSLYAPGTAGPWAQHVRVRLDGKDVLDGPMACHPSWPDQIQIGRNSIGGSTAGPAFTGRVLAVERPTQPR